MLSFWHSALSWGVIRLSNSSASAGVREKLGAYTKVYTCLELPTLRNSITKQT